MGMELDRIKTPVSVRDIQLLHVGSIIRQSAFEAEAFFYHLRYPPSRFRAVVMQFVDTRRPKYMPTDANPFELATDTGGPIADTYQ